MLPKFYDTIKNDLEILESKLIEYLLTPNKPTNQVLSHIFSSGGKRIRPAIFLLCSQLIDYDGEFKFPIASVCEYIHTASLLHDDVIDNSSLRRNKPTVNSIWGDETAVLSGDLIYSAACRLMVKTRSLELIDDFAECIRFMSESELFQLELLWKKDTSLSDYERVVSGKTAILFQASAKTPCYLKNVSQELSMHFANYGKFLGFAFQIFDDYLDYEGNEELLGKPVVTDLLEGKVTLPLIYSLQSENKKLDVIVSSVLENGKISSEDKSKLLLNVKECGGLEKSLNLAEFYSQKARDALTEIAKILKLSEKQKLALDALNQITYFVLNRKN